MECKSIVFVEDLNNPGTDKILKMAKAWYNLNKDNIYNIHGTFGTIEDQNSYKKNRVCLVLHYQGEGGVNPVDCLHEHQETIVIDNPTCKHEGTNHIVCNDCHMILDITHPEKLVHQYKFTSNNDATCLNDGTSTGTCLLCGDKITKTDNGTALGHDYVWSTETEATCLTDKIEVGICSRCHDSINRTVENTKLGHEYTYVSDDNATCTEDSTETGTCIRCGHTVIRPLLNTALGHEYPNDWTLRTKPTCNREGIEFKKCIRCNNEITRSIPIVDHIWISNEDGTHTCVTEDGCHVTEACSPVGLGAICEKCGYTTPYIITKTINTMETGVEFSQKLEANIPDTDTWSIINGTLPEGIDFNSDGTLTGTPTKSGKYTFTVQVEYNGYYATREYSITLDVHIYTVTFDPMGGSVSETSRQLTEGDVIGTLPEPTKDGFIFGGWFTASSGGLKIDENYSIASDTTLYARWGESQDDMNFGDATSTFNIQYDSGPTNYNDQPYTFYHRYNDGSESNLTIQTAISSEGNSNNMTDDNPTVKLFMKVNNNGESGKFDIGFDCDSKLLNMDCINITRTADGIQVGNSPVYYNVTVPYKSSVWIGKYNKRTANRYKNVEEGFSFGNNTGRGGSETDSGYAFTMNDIYISKDSYTVLEVTFQKVVN